MSKLSQLLENKPLNEMNALELALFVQKKTFSYLSADDAAEIREAIELATWLHAGQERRSRNNSTFVPYIEHPLRNTARIIRWNCYNKTVLIASLLHDTVEDCSHVFVEGMFQKQLDNEEICRNSLRDYIRTQFGDRVIAVIDDVTNPPFNNPETKNEEYLQHVKKVIHNEAETFLVKFSDLVDNALSLPYALNRDFAQKQTVKYHPVLEVFDSELSNLETRGFLDKSVRTEDMHFKLQYALTTH